MTNVRRALIVIGVLAMIYGVVAAITGTAFHPVGQVKFLIESLIGHDGIVGPAAIIGGVVLTRWLPLRIRPVIQAALYASLVVTLVALPFMLSDGHSADNTSVLPLNYTHGWLWLLAVVWFVALLAIVWRLRPAARPARAARVTRSDAT